jgi:Right handed beta helix region
MTLLGLDTVLRCGKCCRTDNRSSAGWFLFLLSCLLLLSPPSALAAFYHVSTAGDDAGTGDASDPWRTLSKAGQAAIAGDVVIIHEGVYAETLAPANSGTGEDQRILFTAAPGEEVILDGGTGRLTDWTLESGTPGVNAIYRRPFTGPLYGLFQDDFSTAGRSVALWDMGAYNQYDSNPNFDLHEYDPTHDDYGPDRLAKHDGFSQYKYADGVLRVRTWDAQSPDDHDVRGAVLTVGLQLADRQYITIQGLKLRHYKYLVAIDDSSNIVLDMCDMRYSAWTGIWVTRSPQTQISRCTILGAGSWIGHYEDCLHLTDSDGVVLEANDIGYGGHGNIFVDGGKYLQIRNNMIRDSGGTLLTMKYAPDFAVVENNTFAHAATTATVSVHKVAHAALQLNGGTGCIFRRNICYGCGYGWMISSDFGSFTNANRFENNVIYGSEYDGVWLLPYPGVPSAQMSENTFVNNIFANSGGYEVRMDFPDTSFLESNNSFRSNLFYGRRPLRLWTLNSNPQRAELTFPAIFQHNPYADPGFVDPLSDLFSLQPGSPAIDAGEDLGQPYFGFAPDIGAFEMLP